MDNIKMKLHRATTQASKLKRGVSDSTVTIESLIELIELQDNKCGYCLTDIFLNSDDCTLDHIKCISKGGKHTIDNVVWACRVCNSRKGNREHDLYSFARDDD